MVIRDVRNRIIDGDLSSERVDRSISRYRQLESAAPISIKLRRRRFDYRRMDQSATPLDKSLGLAPLQPSLPHAYSLVSTSAKCRYSKSTSLYVTLPTLTFFSWHIEEQVDKEAEKDFNFMWCRKKKSSI